MRILILSELFYPHGGGAELATWLYTKALANEGFDITILTSRLRNEKRIEKIGKHIKIVRIFRRIQSIQDTRYHMIVNLGFLLSEFIINLIKEADIIYIPGMLYTVIPIAKAFRKPVILHLHNYSVISPSAIVLASPTDNFVRRSLTYDYICYHRLKYKNTFITISSALLNEIIGKNLNKLGLLADVLICVSKRQADIIIKYNQTLSNKIKVLYNPLPEITLTDKKLSAKPTILYTGGSNYLKGFHILLRILKNIGVKKFYNCKFILTNQYDYRSIKILQQIKKIYDLDVEVLGRITYEKLIRLYRSAWAFFFPSIWEEPLPYAIIESMLTNTIPIASRVGGVPELIRGTFAEKFLFEPSDVKRAEKLIEELFSWSACDVLQVSSKLQDSIMKRINNEKIFKIFKEILDKCVS